MKAQKTAGMLQHQNNVAIAITDSDRDTADSDDPNLQRKTTSDDHSNTIISPLPLICWKLFNLVRIFMLINSQQNISHL